MRVAMIGAGRLAQALGRPCSEAGHDVVLSNSRGPETLLELARSLGENVTAASVAEAVDGADVTILCTRWNQHQAALQSVHDWTGRILVDPSNNRMGPGPDAAVDLGGRSSTSVVQQFAPGARLVKAFNTTGITTMAEALGQDSGPANAIFIAGDDTEAKRVVALLIADIGGEAVDTGDLEQGSLLQGMDQPLCGLPRMYTPAEAREMLASARQTLGLE